MIYLHIGTHKTGTTTIQNYLEKYKQYLETQNIIYITTLKDYNPKKINILSDEKLCGNLETLYKDTLLYHNNIKNKLNKLNIKNVNVILFVRDQVEIIQSAYIQYVQQGKQLDIFNILNYADYLYYTNIIDIWKNSFKTMVLPYDKNVFQIIDIVSLFFSIISNKIKIQKYSNSNISLCGNAVIIMEKIIELNKTKTIDTNAIRRYLQKIAHKNLFEQHNILPKNIIQQLYDKYRTDNAILFKKYLHNNFQLNNFSHDYYTTNKEPSLDFLASKIKENFNIIIS